MLIPGNNQVFRPGRNSFDLGNLLHVRIVAQNSNLRSIPTSKPKKIESDPCNIMKQVTLISLHISKYRVFDRVTGRLMGLNWPLEGNQADFQKINMENPIRKSGS